MGKNKGKRKPSGARIKSARSCSYERTGTWSVEEDEAENFPHPGHGT